MNVEQPPQPAAEPEPRPEEGTERDEAREAGLVARVTNPEEPEAIDPYDQAEQLFAFRAAQLQAQGHLPELNPDMTADEFNTYMQLMSDLHQTIYEQQGLIWPPPWLEEEEMAISTRKEPPLAAPVRPKLTKKLIKRNRNQL